MTDKLTAIELAFALDSRRESSATHYINQAAAELRRLHAETVNRQDWYVEWQKWEQTAKKFERQRNELLEALELLVSYTESCEGLLNTSPAGQVLKARAAIAKAEGTPND